MSHITVPKEWSRQLAAAIAATLREYQAQELCDISIATFHVGCYPWHGLIELSLLTAAEWASDPLLNAPEEVAAWQHYDFAADLAAWQAAIQLKHQMADACATAAETEHPVMAAAYLRACAEVVATPEVPMVLAMLNQSKGFRTNVVRS